MSSARREPRPDPGKRNEPPPSIVAEGVALRFVLERHSSLKSVALQTLGRVFGRVRIPPSAPRELWPLQDIDLQLVRGDRLGIVGRNGAGKTTLLRVLAGIYPPTRGRVTRVGTIAPVLQLGLGFHAELTGRENVHLASAIAGTPLSTMKAKLDEIFRFAELEDYVDVPLKYYSTGMYARLAFAVATELETDTLLLDEVFAVGDQYWIRSALERIESLIDRVGILVLVSHDLGLIERICNRAILLDEGRIQLDGSVPEVLDRYRSGA
ncbi:MAG: ABC transporter ATP-binding protein [Spirochaetaceae bacterium]|nr:ABC transporter ATP-binding protein [Myxococcales bacterium]MCB9725709.1 ABC transporter ATP-binding protein [Spirochaetaceae bacterium]